MARLPRLSLRDVPQHIIQRGNNRQVCFASEEDYLAYIGWLKEYAKKYQVDVHAWVLMTNHVHLLCTPRTDDAVSKMMQALGGRYVRYFNHRYQRTGTLWEGRYKSCIVQQEDYLMQVYRYIELNPVRAGMVAEVRDYLWSSYHVNALGKNTELCTPHEVYYALASAAEDRLLCYQALFTEALSMEQISKIRASLNKGIVLGNSDFSNQIVALTGKRLTTGKQGRPLGWRKKVGEEN